MDIAENEEGMDIAEEGTLAASTRGKQRGMSMGKELDNITRGLGSRILVVINEGKRRPQAPLQAAKLACEAGIILRQHVPIYTSWKEYKKDENKFKDQMDSFIGKLFEKCAKTKANREKVKFHQCTGARSYTAAGYVVKQEKYKDTEPTAIDLFNALHCSKIKGLNESAKKADDDMEEIMTRAVEGEQEKTCTEIVSQVLPKSSTFLRNVGLQQPVATTKTVVVSPSPQMLGLQARFDAEKEESVGLRQKLQRLEAQAEESEAKAQKQAEEIDILKKATTNTQNLVRQMISFGQSQVIYQTTP